MNQVNLSNDETTYPLLLLVSSSDTLRFLLLPRSDFFFKPFISSNEEEREEDLEDDLDLLRWRMGRFLLFKSGNFEGESEELLLAFWGRGDK